MTKTLIAAAVLAASPLLSHAGGITDPAGDFLKTFAGSTSSGDLDVLSASVTYNPGTDVFTLSSTMNGAVGSTPNNLYVWGVNRGAGTAGFKDSLGLDNVLFDTVVLLKSDGTGLIPGVGALPTGAIKVSGDTISASFSAALLPSTGFAKSAYTWNLWPRDTSFSGVAAISDFAPDNSNLRTAAVPEPGTVALMLAGLGLVGFSARRRRA